MYKICRKYAENMQIYRLLVKYAKDMHKICQKYD